MVDFIFQKTKEFINKMPKEIRKTYGQFFTCPEIARFMVSLFDLPKQTSVSFIDPGAGSGLLTIALLERLYKVPSVKEIHFKCYENDPNILKILEENIAWSVSQSRKKVTYEIIKDNYILSQAQAYKNKSANDKVDLIIANPPYLKIGRTAPEANAMPDICYGAPNLYFLFAMMSLFNLSSDGEMVYIIPRSWTSGAYFTAFRKRFLEEGKIDYIHLFLSRSKVFSTENVLQETMIIKVKKTATTPKYVNLSTSINSLCTDITTFSVSYSDVVKGNECYVFLPTDITEASTIHKLENFSDTLLTIGLRMRTGITVDFRHKECLRNSFTPGCVPLFYACHINDGRIRFPFGKNSEYLYTDLNGLKQQNTNYLFVKRFTAKEEPRRLQCGIYLSEEFPEFTKISTHNKINFICGEKPLSKDIVYGLYVLFNSTIYDTYYRVLNGSTQVNATEINTLPMPDINTIIAMGKELAKKRELTVSSCDAILNTWLRK